MSTSWPALWAIIADTWRQSRQQIVFLIMSGLLGLFAIAAVIMVRPIEVEDESGAVHESVGIMGLVDGPELEQGWAALYATSVLLAHGDMKDRPDPFSEEGQALQRELLEVELEAVTKPPKQRAVEVVIFGLATAIFSVSMMFFIGASAGYFPAMLEAGAIDVVLAKPLERWQIYLGKYLGGLGLYTAAVVGTYALIFVGLGLRTGIWHPAIAMVLPLQVLAAATLFALIALLGVLSRSTSLCIIVGYAFYVIVDSIVSAISQFPAKAGWFQTLQEVLRATLPSFDRIKQTSTLSVIDTAAFDGQTILVAVVWLVLSLGLGYWKFSRTDY